MNKTTLKQFFVKFTSVLLGYFSKRFFVTGNSRNDNYTDADLVNATYKDGHITSFNNKFDFTKVDEVCKIVNTDYTCNTGVANTLRSIPDVSYLTAQDDLYSYLFIFTPDKNKYKIDDDENYLQNFIIRRNELVDSFLKDGARNNELFEEAIVFKAALEPGSGGSGGSSGSSGSISEAIEYKNFISKSVDELTQLETVNYVTAENYDDEERLVDIEFGVRVDDSHPNNYWKHNILKLNGVYAQNGEILRDFVSIRLNEIETQISYERTDDERYFLNSYVDPQRYFYGVGYVDKRFKWGDKDNTYLFDSCMKVGFFQETVADDIVNKPLLCVKGYNESTKDYLAYFHRFVGDIENYRVSSSAFDTYVGSLSI